MKAGIVKLSSLTFQNRPTNSALYNVINSCHYKCTINSCLCVINHLGGKACYGAVCHVVGDGFAPELSDLTLSLQTPERRHYRN